MADATALLLDCTAGPDPTAHLLLVAGEYTRLGVPTEIFAVADLAGQDEAHWDELLAKIAAADIIVIGTPTRFGVRSSVAQLVVERLAGSQRGRELLRNKVGGVVASGDDEVARLGAQAMLRDLAWLGAAIPPDADAYGPAADAADAAVAAVSARRMALNTAHLARLLVAQPFPTEADGSDAPVPARGMFATLAQPLPPEVDQAAIDAERRAAEEDRLVERRRTLDLTRREKGLPEKRKLPRPAIDPDAGGAGAQS